MQKNKIKKYLSISLILAFILPAFTARADLVDDLIKEYKLDPKNNPKDQCDLMNELYKKTEFSFKNKNISGVYCDKNKEICMLTTPPINFYSDYKAYSPRPIMLFYNNKTKNILGALFFNAESEDYYDPDLLDEYFYKEVRGDGEILIDVEDNEQFMKHRKKYIDNSKWLKGVLEDYINLTESGYYSENYGTKFYPQKIIKDKTSFLRIRGCYIDEFRIAKAKKFLNLNYK